MLTSRTLNCCFYYLKNESQFSFYSEIEKCRAKICTPFRGHFTKIDHNIDTRNKGCSLKLPKAKLEFGQRSFAFQGALVYKTLTRNLRNLNSRLLFKSNLKVFFQ